MWDASLVPLKPNLAHPHTITFKLHFLNIPRHDIQQELTILQPHTITQAIGLAKLVECKLSDQANNATKPLPLMQPNQPLLVVRPQPLPTLPIKRSLM